MQTSQIPGGIQPHSMGSLFPAVIARVERYEEWGPLNFYADLAPRLLTTSYELTLGDFCEEYATYEDAELAARGLLEGVRLNNPMALQAVGVITEQEAEARIGIWNSALARNGMQIDRGSRDVVRVVPLAADGSEC